MSSLDNIFISTRQNKLRLAKICFSNKIEDITFLSDEFDWKDVDSIDKLNQFNKNNSELFNEGNLLLAMPGAIDPHVHFNTPGFEYREDFEHATTAAATGGVTTIIDMPCTSIPPVTSQNNLVQKLNALKHRSLVDYALWGGIRGNDFENQNEVIKQIHELDEAGVAGYKAYLISGMSEFQDLSLEQMRFAMENVAKTGKPLGVHAEDKELITSRRTEYQDANINTWEAYCSTRDSRAEEKAIANLISLANAFDIRVHVVHLSSKAGIEQIKIAQELDLNFTSETCPHYLFFTQKDFDNLDIRNLLKTAPPVKFYYDREALWKALQDNRLSFVTTDHAGCNSEDEKSSDNFWKVYGGVPGVEHRVPFLFSEGFLKAKVELEQTIKLLSSNAAEFFNLKSKGTLEIGKDADIALINLWEGDQVRAEHMHSKGKYTPFNGILFKAKVERTYLRGRTIFDRNNQAEESVGFGDFIPVKNTINT